jgi:hypothetical protein
MTDASEFIQINENLQFDTQNFSPEEVDKVISALGSLKSYMPFWEDLEKAHKASGKKVTICFTGPDNTIHASFGYEPHEHKLTIDRSQTSNFIKLNFDILNRVNYFDKDSNLHNSTLEEVLVHEASHLATKPLHEFAKMEVFLKGFVGQDSRYPKLQQLFDTSFEFYLDDLEEIAIYDTNQYRKYKGLPERVFYTEKCQLPKHHETGKFLHGHKYSTPSCMPKVLTKPVDQEALSEKMLKPIHDYISKHFGTLAAVASEELKTVREMIPADRGR